jgi:hypothetical protein
MFVLRIRSRHRLIGALALAMMVGGILPLVLDAEPRPVAGGKSVPSQTVPVGR